MIERISIANRNSDINFNIFLTNKAGKLDEMNGINDFITEELEKSINKPIENELIVFNIKSDNNFLNVKFLKQNKTNNFDFTTLYSDIGFTVKEINNDSDSFINSFFIFEYFDSKDENKQVKLSTNFIKPSSIHAKASTTAVINFSKDNIYNSQHNRVYIPNKFFNNGSNIIFMKVSFFNAKTGKRNYFYNLTQDIV